jgi:hypothetical protein
MRLAFALLLALAAAPAARAGGAPLAVAATAGRVWVANGDGVIELDARSGRIVHVAGTRFAYATGLALTDGNVWATSVRNGFGAGAVTRIPFGAGFGRTPLVLPHRPVFAIASDGRATWTLAGGHGVEELFRIDAATRRLRRVAVPRDVAFVAADDSGLVPGLFAVTTAGWVLRYGATGSAVQLARVTSAQAPPAVGLGRVWLPGNGRLVALDAASGARRGELRIPGAQLAAVGGGFVWVLRLHDRRPTLLKVDPARMRVVARAELPGRAAAGLTWGDDRVWVAQASPRRRIWELDPRTLRRRLFATVP